MLPAKSYFEVSCVDNAAVSSTLNRLPLGAYFPQISQETRVADKPALSLERKDKRSKITNEFGLTERQMEVLQQLALGRSNKEIGLAIGLAEGTVKIHLATIFQALCVSKRTDAVQTAHRMGMLEQHIPR